MDHFISGYVGLNFVDTPPRRGAPPPVDIVSGATVTLMVIGDSITRSAIAVARAHGVGKAARPAQATARVQARTVDETPGEVRSWQALLDNGAVRQLRLSVADVNQAFRASGRDDAAAHAKAATRPMPSSNSMSRRSARPPSAAACWARPAGCA